MSLLRGVECVDGVHRLGRSRRDMSAPVVQDAAPKRQTAEFEVALREAQSRMDAQQRQWEQRAESELAAKHQSAMAEGRATGQAQAQAEVKAAFEAKLRQLDGLMEALGQLLGQRLEAAEDAMVAIAYESVVKIVGEGMATPEGVRAWVTQALARVRQLEGVIVRLSKEDHELLGHMQGDAGVLSRPGISFRPDDTLGAGECVFETDRGQLDARLTTQLSMLQQVLLAARGSNQAGAS